MELPHIGQNCFVCNRNDYLPFKCAYCDKTVCIDHKANHGSECRLNSTHFDGAPRVYPDTLKGPCDYCKKITLKLELVECSYCKSQHCLYHRHQILHECRQLLESQETSKKEAKERSEKQKAALDKLKEDIKLKQTPHSNESLIKKRPLDPKQQNLAKKIRVMRIKQSARGPPNILEEDKIYFEIKFVHEPQSALSDESKHNNNIKLFTTPKHTIGRMIDWSADELGITNKNNIKEASQLILRKQINSSEMITLESHACFSQYINSGELENGDEIILTYNN